MKQKLRVWRHAGDKKKKAVLHYTACGLDDVYLASGYEIRPTPYGEELAIRGIDGLHRAIGLYLAERKKVLVGKEVRFLRTQLDITQSELARMLGCDAQQVARYEKGQNKISGPADRILRLLYMQSAGGHVNVREILHELDEMDARINDKVRFEDTPQGWKRLAA